MAERATILVEADVTDANEAFNSLGRRGTYSIERVLAATTRGELAANRFARAWRRASAETLVAFARMDRGFVAFTRRLRSRFTGFGGLGVGIAGFAAVREQMGLDRIVADIARLTGTSLATPAGQRLREDVQRRALGVSRGQFSTASAAEVAASVRDLIEKGLSPEQAFGAQLGITTSATAFNTAIEDMTDLAFGLVKTFDVSLPRLNRAIEVLAATGERGGFELNEMAREVPQITAVARQLGESGLGGAARLGALLQVAKLTSPSPEEATTLVRRTFEMMLRPKVKARLAAAGVDPRATGIEQILQFSEILGRMEPARRGAAIQRVFGTMRMPLRLLAFLSGGASAEDVQTRGLGAGATNAAIVRSIAEQSAAAQITEARARSQVASASVRLEKGFNELKDQAIEASGALELLAKGADFFAAHPRLSLVGFLAGGVLSAGAPGLLAGGSWELGKRMVARRAVEVAGQSAAAAAAGSAATGAAAGMAARRGIPWKTFGWAALPVALGSLALADYFGDRPGKDWANVGGLGEMLHKWRGQGERSGAVSVRIIDATSQGIEVEARTGRVEDEAELE